MDLVLRHPELDDESAFLRAYEATKISDPNFAHFYHFGMDYIDWLRVLKEKSAGVGLESGYGRSVFFLAWIGENVVGRLTFRLSLEVSLLRSRGHIGFVVLPEYRLRGYATEMLQRSLPIAKQAGLKRIVVTCDEGNIGSQKTIERCGGIFEGINLTPGEPISKRVYRIDLP
jgi:predicted acetyltransferase